MFASLSIYGLYSYDDSLFDNLVLPSAFTEQERDDTIMTILERCSDLALLYPDFDFMKMLIGVWSRNELHIWNKLLESERIEFNPIENYDRHETLTRTIHSGSKEEDSRQSASAGHGSRQDSGSSGSTGANAGSSTGTSGQTAYDSDTIKNTSRSVGDTQSSSTSSEHHSGEAVENSSAQAAESGKRSVDSNGTETVLNHTHGNIGVTQAADMLARFREVSDFCTIDFIVESFRDRFCVQVY